MPFASVSRMGRAGRSRALGQVLARYASGLALSLGVILAAGEVSPQELLSGGDAAVTQFSGLSRGADGTPRPDPDGAVVRLLGIADPEVPADGAVRSAPRLLLSRTARDLGQVFAVAFDGASPANVYLAASSAFGLYRTPNGEWADGMWGPEGGPGTIWKLNAARGYRAERFADIGYLDAPNSAAGLGGLAFDPRHEQLFVSDLESGLIHRLDLDGGELLESFDHGVDGRAFFLDAATGQDETRDPVMHDPSRAPRFDDCAVEFAGVEDEMPFDSAPECWNFAPPERRVWGLGVFRAGEDGPVRLFYAVWGGAALGAADWSPEAEDAATSIWSVALTDDGWFDASDVRREIVLPPLTGDGDGQAARPPVTSIAFTETGDMVLAERAMPTPYYEEPAYTQLLDPHNARVLRLTRDGDGAWEIAGRYPAGYPVRTDDPAIRANAAGGVAVPAGGQDMIWLSVEPLCTEDGPCPDPESGEATVADRTGGILGIPADAVVELDSPADEEAALEQSLLLSVRGAGEVPGDMGAIALHPGDAPPVRIVGRPTGRPAPEPALEAPPEDVAEAEEPEVPEAPAEDVEVLAAEDVDTDLSVTKTAPEECRPGEECRFEITLENAGTRPYGGPLLITDTLGSAGVSFVSSSPQDWSCDSANANVFCRNGALDLAPGDSVTISLTVRLPSDFRTPRLENCGAITWLGRAGRERIRAVQAELNRRGFDAGPADGAMGPQTAAGIREAEAAFDLPETGDITPQLIEAMYGEGAYLGGDDEPANDRACATADVDVPPPPPAEVRQPTPPPASPPSPPAAQAPPRAHGTVMSQFHQRRASAQHNRATSGPTPVHQRAFSEFHMRYRSSQHDGIRSEFVAGHDATMSRFHQRFESRLHDIETSGPRRFHSVRDSGPGGLHDGFTSGVPRIHDGWTSRWR